MTFYWFCVVRRYKKLPARQAGKQAAKPSKTKVIYSQKTIFPMQLTNQPTSQPTATYSIWSPKLYCFLADVFLYTICTFKRRNLISPKVVWRENHIKNILPQNKFIQKVDSWLSGWMNRMTHLNSTLSDGLIGLWSYIVWGVWNWS